VLELLATATLDEETAAELELEPLGTSASELELWVGNGQKVLNSPPAGQVFCGVEKHCRVSA
jgi:hypothetical protein